MVIQGKIGLVLIAGALGAVLADPAKPIPDLVWIIFAGGALLIAWSEIAEARLGFSEMRKRFEKEYAPAARCFLNELRAATDQNIVLMAQAGLNPHPDPLGAWRSLDESTSALKHHLVRFYANDEPDVVFAARKQMRVAYAEWSEALRKPISSRWFKKNFRSVEKKHRKTLVLWLWCECALAEGKREELGPPDFTVWKPLMDEWLGSK